MSADFQIHSTQGLLVPENPDDPLKWPDLRCFFANTIGSVWFGLPRHCNGHTCEHFNRISKTSSVTVGEVSWLKSILFDDPETYLPGTVDKIQSVISDRIPVLDDELRQEILVAFDTPNNSIYMVSKKEQVARWLEDHLGERLFTVSW